MDAIWAGCVPVIIADHYHLPFSELVDWATFSVIVRESQLDRLKDVLQSIPDEVYAELQRNLAHVRPRFIWNDPPIPGDAFYSILTLLWRRRHLVLSNTD